MTQHHHIKVRIAPGTDPAKAVISGKVRHSNALQEQCESILSTFESGKQAEARKAYQALKQKYPNATLVKQLQALILYHDGRFSQAYRVIREILKQTPNNAGRLNFQGLIQRQLGMFEEAIESYRKAIEIKPDFADPYNNLAIINRYYGEIDKAIENFRRAISIKPDYPAAIYNLSCMKAYQLSDEEIAKAKDLLKKAENNEDRARCCFSLYNTYLNKEEHGKAFTYLKQGNDLIQKHLPIKKPLSTYVSEVKENFTRQFYENRILLTPQEKLPVFIVGMPRSGSSLLEQMLASHSKIFGLGESRSMPELLLSVDRRAETSLPLFMEEFGKLDRKTLQERMQTYLGSLPAVLAEYPVYTDKMLKNFKTIGFIKILLPNARFIHIKRHPLDNCLACFEKKFTSGHEYTYDLEVLGNYFLVYLELMDFWKDFFPDDICEVQYESLVREPESTLSDCLDFLGLKFESNCLEYHSNDRIVFTASTDQVREKINDRSIGKWLKFEKELKPLLKTLRDGGLDFTLPG